MKMDTYIEYYCGTWKGSEGNLIEISKVNDQELRATFYSPNKDSPINRPWFNNKPAKDMKATLDNEYQTELEIHLGNSTDGFYFDLSLDFLDSSNRIATSSITRYEKDDHFEKFYHLLPPVGQYEKC